MRRSNTPSRHRADGRGRRAPTSRRWAAAGIGLALVLGSACVTRGTHDEVVNERDSLRGQVESLTRSNAALGQERVKLLEEMEDLREAREGLSVEIAELQRTRDQLSTNLREREEEVQELSKLQGNYEELVKDLESEVAAGQIQIEQLTEGLRLNLSQEILFRSGAVNLEPYGVGVLKKVSAQLVKFPQHVEVQGHTDDVPLSAGLARRWGTNWELAAARATQVVRLFEDEGVDPSRLRAVSYGPHAPVADNDSAEGRAKNRRIEIRLIPVKGGEQPSGGDDASS